MTIAPFDWEWMYATDNHNYLDVMRLAVVGQIGAWHSDIHSINYTLSHHCETDEVRVWNDFQGRLVSYTGECGGNDHGVDLTDWKHGIGNHALSKIELCTE